MFTGNSDWLIRREGRLSPANESFLRTYRSLARCRYSSRTRRLPWNRSWPRRLRAVIENGSGALRSKGRRAGAERRNGAQRIVERRPECSGAQPNLRRKRGASGGPKLPSVTSANVMQRIDHRREGDGAGAWAWRGMEERWSRRVDRIEQWDSPVFSIPVRAGSAHCLFFLASKAYDLSQPPRCM